MSQVNLEPDSAEGADLHLRLTRLIGLRLCHDLGGLAGTIGNALEMLNDAGAEAADLAGEAADMLRRRLLLWRSVLGSGEARTLGAVLALLKGQIAGGRAHLEIGDLSEDAPLSDTMVPSIRRGKHSGAPSAQAAPGDFARLDEALQIHPIQGMDGQPRSLHQHQGHNKRDRGATAQAARPPAPPRRRGDRGSFSHVPPWLPARSRRRARF